MATQQRGRAQPGASVLAGKRHKPVPFEFVLEALAPLAPLTRPMFGCLAVYVEEQIVLILRDRPDSPEDNGVWLATTTAHHASLRKAFPKMRSVQVFGKAVTDWQVLAADWPDFEDQALRACQLLLARDPRLGKVPKPRRPARRQGSTSRSPRPPARQPGKRR